MLKKKIIIFSCCVVISLISWLSIKLSKSYHYNFSLNYEIQNIPKNIRINSNIKNTINIHFRADGFKIASLSKNLKNPHLFFDLSSINYSKNITSGILKIPTEILVSQFNKNFLNNVEITSFSPDTLYFETTELVSKKVPIRTMFKIPESAVVFETECIKLPDSTTISGNKTDIDSIHFLYTENIDMHLFSKQEIQNIKLLSPNSKIKLAHSQIDVRLSNPQKIKIKLSIDVQDSFDKEYKYTPSTKQISIEYETDMSLICNHQADSFRVEMNIIEKKDNIVPLKLSKHPHNINNIKINPSQTHFSKEKK